MAARMLLSLLFLVVVTASGSGAEPPGDAVADYETRLEEIAKEVASIREELEALVAEVVEGEAGRVHVFLDKLPTPWNGQGFALYLDGTRVFSRPFTPAEQHVLERGLPLELGAWRLLAGEHRAALVPLGEAPGDGYPFTVSRGTIAAWVASPGEAGMAWRVE